VTSASDVLRAMFAHHTWATLSQRLEAETLDERIEGTYGSIAETLTHLMDADDRYLQRMRDPRPPDYVDHGTQSPVAP
jgi:uncharacterized damage-inducible protein DinB